MTSDPYEAFIRDVANDPQLFPGDRCRLSRNALHDIGVVIETQPYSVALTYLLERASRARDEGESRAFRQLQAHLKRGVSNGLNPVQLGFLVRKLHIFRKVLEALK